MGDVICCATVIVFATVTIGCSGYLMARRAVPQLEAQI